MRLWPSAAAWARAHRECRGFSLSLETLRQMKVAMLRGKIRELGEHAIPPPLVERPGLKIERAEPCASATARDGNRFGSFEELGA